MKLAATAERQEGPPTLLLGVTGSDSLDNQHARGGRGEGHLPVCDSLSSSHPPLAELNTYVEQTRCSFAASDHE